MSDRQASLLSSFTLHRDALLRFLKRKLGNAALAEDMTQETWLRATVASAVGAPSNPRSYLFRIAGNLVLDHQRHHAHGIELEATDSALMVADPAPSPEDNALSRSELKRLLAVVETLPPRCREVFVLCRFDGLSHAEIATRLGISKSTVVTHVVHALSVLDKALSETRR